MLAYDFDYYQPNSIQEATELYGDLHNQKKNPVYFAGGTEIITLGRVNKIVTGAVIDIKHIPECRISKEEDGQLTLGAAITLTKIRDLGLYPFMERVIAEIADNTARNKITLGGNICANIIYREAVLPLLLARSVAVTADKDGIKERPFHELFDQKLKLNDGELLVQIKIDLDDTKLPYFTIKKRRQWGVGYPLITIAAQKKDGNVMTAFSGLCAFPFSSQEMNEHLNNKGLPVAERINRAVQHLPDEILHDVHGSDQYRMFVLKNLLMDTLNALAEEETNG